MRNFFRKYFNGFLVIFIAIFSFTVLGTEQIEAKPEEVKIGVALALSGQSAHAGHAIVQGLKLAVDQYTEKGGFEVAGKKYVPELLINDTGGSPANGVAQAEKLVNKYNAKVIFGCTLSHVAIPMLGVTQPAKVIHVSSCTGWEKYIGRPGNDYMFKLIGPQADAARSYIPAVVKRWNIKTVVQIMVNDDPGRMYAEVYGKAAERNGVKVLETFFYDPKLEEFYPVLTKIKTMNPDAIWMGAFNDPFAVSRSSVP